MDSQVTSFVVDAFRIIGTDLVIAVAYEPVTYDGHKCSHSVVKTMDGIVMGQIGTRDLPADLDALPARSDERFEAVRAWQNSEYERAYGLIRWARAAEHVSGERIPWGVDEHRQSMGEITYLVPQN